tara:strand:+ start:260 stop:604 length:345 start_codon:yes stop_codon:yes gene_type:complete
MELIDLTFNNLNTSLQVGDTIWYVPIGEKGGYNTNTVENVVKLGEVENINNNSVSIFSEVELSVVNDTFIMFSKNNKVNLGNLKGYYAEVKFVNNSKDKAELFSVGSEISISSK